jgi:hypothetical protein
MFAVVSGVRPLLTVVCALTLLSGCGASRDGGSTSANAGDSGKQESSSAFHAEHCVAPSEMAALLGIELTRVYAKPGKTDGYACAYNNGSNYDAPDLPRAYIIADASVPLVPVDDARVHSVPGVRDGTYSVEEQSNPNAGTAYVLGIYCHASEGWNLLVQAFSRQPFDPSLAAPAAKRLCA